MKRLMQIAIVLTIFTIILVSASCQSKVTISRSLASSIPETQSTIGIDNFTSQSENITQPIQIIDVDKRTGKELRSESSVITLTPEQQAEIQRQIEEKKKLKDTSQIRFPSRYIISVAAGTIDESIYRDEKASDTDYYVIQFYTDTASVDKNTRDLLEQSGCILYDHISNNAFYTKIPPEALDKVISLVKTGKVRYLGRIPTEAKISTELLDKAQANPDEQFNLVIQLFDKANPDLINSLKDIVQVTSYHYDISNYVYGSTLGSSIRDIISVSFVKWVGGQTVVYGLNNDGTSAVSEPQEYLVVLNTRVLEYKNQILTINSVTYIGDATFRGTNNEEYPAIVISANPAAAEKIRMLYFVIAVSPTDSVPYAPVPPPSAETTKEICMRSFIIAGIFAILMLAIITIFYLRKRYQTHP